MRRALLLLTLSLAGCGEAVKDDHFANEIKADTAEQAPAKPGIVPVRIGELGPNFNACNAAGTTRKIDAAGGELLQIRTAPFEVAEEAGSLPAGGRFFICSRSHDQRWIGIVYTEAGDLSHACGVSRPVVSRRPYEGPCRSGWVSSAFVKQIAG